MSAPPSNALQGAIQKLAFHEPLTAEDAEGAFNIVMQGQATSVQIAALLLALRATGESSEVVAGVVRAMRSAMLSLSADDPDALVDTCGTGGGAVSTFNISTAAAIVAAGAGVRIAKHGNRSFTSRCGSADVLEALGVAIEVTVPVMERALKDAGIVFMFAPLMHPAMRHVGAVRRELGIPTVMNIVGPLANPARAGRQVVGVADLERAPILAGALSALGATHALVVHGEPGLDEVSPLGATHVIEVMNGTTKSWTIDPAEHGFKRIAREDLVGRAPAENAKVIEEVLAGAGPKGARAAIVLNAGAAVYVSGRVKSYGEGVAAAAKAIDSGRAKSVLERMFETGAPPDDVIKELGLSPMGDDAELAATVERVIESNPKAVADFRGGKEAALQALVGPGMRATRGRADPGRVRALITPRLARAWCCRPPSQPGACRQASRSPAAPARTWKERRRADTVREESWMKTDSI